MGCVHADSLGSQRHDMRGSHPWIHGGEEAARCLSDNVPVLWVGFCVLGFQMHRLTSAAVRVLLTRVVADQELPFAIKAPNAATQAAVEEGRERLANRRACFDSAQALSDDLEKARRP